MPIYEYKCRHCGEKFEALTLTHSQEQILCVKCGSELVERILSVFASTGGHTSSSPSAPTCNPSSRFS